MEEQLVKEEPMREQSVAKGFAVLSVAGIIVKLLSLLYIPFLLAIIGEEGNGIYAAAYQVYVLVYAISNSGIPVALSKLVSELIAVGNYKDAIRSFKIARFLLLVIGVIMAALMFFAARPISKIMHYEKSYLAILALSPTLLFTSIASSYRGYFQGRGNMTPTAVSQIIEQIINTIFTLVFAAALIKYGIEAACAGGTVGTSLGAVGAAGFLVWFHNKKGKMVIPKEAKFRKTERYSYYQLVQKIFAYSIPITLSIGLQYTGNLIDVSITKSRLLTAGFADGTASEMYSHLYKYQQLLNAPIVVVASLGSTILPAISAAVALKNRKLIRDRMNFAFRLCFMVTIPSAVGFAVLSAPIYELLKYGHGSYLMMYGSGAVILMAIVQVQTSILQGSGMFYPVTFNLVLGIVGKILTNYMLIAIPEININGAIIGSVVSYCIPILLNGLLIKKRLRIKIRLTHIAAKPAVASVLMGIGVKVIYRILSGALFFIQSTYVVNALATLISIIAGVLIYAVMLVVLKGLSREELDMLPGSISSRLPERLLKHIQ